MNNFHEEYGYLVKEVSTGKIDTRTQYPVSKLHTENTPLIEGFVWVRVKMSYTEA